MKSLRFPNTETGRREWIKARLRLAGYTLGSLAREIGLSRTAAQQALWQPYPRMERIIADKLGMTAEEIWPERFERRAARGSRDCIHEEKASTQAGRARTGGAQ